MQRDGSDYDNPALDEARNVIPVYNIYRPIRTVETISETRASGNVGDPTPWIDFDGTSSGKVDFSGNPIAAVPDFGFDSTVMIRFRTSSIQESVLAGAGIGQLHPNNPQQVGWNLGIDNVSGRVRSELGTIDNENIVSAESTLPGGYHDGEWHVLAARFIVDDDPSSHSWQTIVGIDGEVVVGGTNFSSDPFDESAWNSLTMRWGRPASGSDQDRFTGDIERVVVVNGTLNIFEWDDEILPFMDNPYANISPGGFSDGHLWLIRENAGTNTEDIAESSPLDGTLDTGATWEGEDFGATGSGITGGIAHFYTAAQQNVERRPREDTIKGADWDTFGRTHPQFPEDFFRQIWSKEPDDSRGVQFQLQKDPTDPTPFSISSYETKLGSFPDPTVDADHIVQYRYRFNAESEPDMLQSLDVSLMQGTSTIATLDSHESGSNADDPEDRDVWHHAVVEVPAVDAGTISNYGDLRLRFRGLTSGAQRQSAIPESDLFNPDGWVKQNGAGNNLWQSINDPFAPSDNTYVESQGIEPGGFSRYRFGLGEVEDPQTNEGLNMVARVQAVDRGMDFLMILKEDGEEISRNKFTDISTSGQNVSFQVPEEDAEDISDYSALEMDAVFISHSSQNTEGDTEEVPLSYVSTVDTAGPVENLQVQGDGQFVSVGAGGDGGRFRCGLEPGHDAGTNDGHTIRLHAFRSGGPASVSVQFWAGGTQIYDSRSFESPRPLPTSPAQGIVFEIPASAIADIPPGGLQNLELQVLTHAGAGGGLGIYDYAAFEYPSRRQGRLYWAILGLPSKNWIGVSWARMQVPDPDMPEAGDVTELYAGDYNALYFVDDPEWSDVSKAGGYAVSEIPRSWDFASFGENLIATNKVDPVQVKSPTDSNFGDLITSTSKPQAATVCAVKRHVILSNIDYTGTTDPDGQPDEWWCSGLDDPADFDVSIATGANRGRTQMTPGEVVGSVGGDFATLFKQNSVVRLDYVGPPGTFRESVISNSDGTKFPRSIVPVERDIYFLDTDGFKVVRQGQYVDRVGDGAVNRMVTDAAFETRAVQPVDSDEIPAKESAAIGAYDNVTNTIWWAIRTIGIQGDEPAPVWRNNVIVIYNPTEDRWSVVELTGETESPADDPIQIGHLFSLPNTREASDSIARGVAAISIEGAFPLDYHLRLKRFLGQDTYAALFRTKIWSSKLIDQAIRELQINFVRPSYRMSPEETARPNVRLIVESADDPLMQIGVRTKEVSLSDANSDLWYPVRESGEYFRFTVIVPRLHNETIRELNGIGIDYQDAGLR